MRIPVKPLSKYPWFLRSFFWNQKRKYRAALQPGLLWGRVPRLFIAIALLYGVLDRKGPPFKNLSSKFNSALDVPSQGFCKLPNNHSNNNSAMISS